MQSGSIIRSAPKNRDFRKTIPAFISIEKEKLYEELNKYKISYHSLVEENRKMKNKI
jgi:hypothetical protein